MRVRALSLLAASAVLTAVSFGPALAAACVNPKDEAAMQARVVQTELMVAALACQQTPRYNEFVTKYQKDLMKAHERLRVFFRKTLGASKGATELNTFITKLANDSSRRSNANRAGFCAESVKLYDIVLAADPKDFATTVSATPVSKLHGFDLCGTQTADGKGGVPLPRRKPAVLAKAPAAAPAAPAATATP